MNRYETVFTIMPTLTEEQAKATTKKFRQILTDAGFTCTLGVPAMEVANLCRYWISLE